jgi:hypothetical protein
MEIDEARIGRILLVQCIACFAMVASAAAQSTPAPRYATAAQIESDFRGKSFLLVGDDQVAKIRAPSWSADRTVTLPFWLGIGGAVPPALRPKQGNYYVISEAYIVRTLRGDEWLIRAGSSLRKDDAVLITTKTRYKTTGVILPTIVQYIESRTMTRSDGSKIDVPVLHEVSLPMTWTKGGPVPTLYAHFTVRP